MENKKSAKKMVISCIVVLLLIVLGTIIFLTIQNSNNNNANVEQIPTGENTTAPFDEAKAHDQKDISKNILVTMSGYDPDEGIYAAAEVSNISEGDGVCYIHAISPNNVEKIFSKQASWDNKTVQCGELNIAKRELSSGLWRIFIEYKSSKHIGKSTTMEVSVP